MAVVRAELKVYKSAVFNDQPTNGGRMSATESPTDVVGNLFLDAPEAERTAGSTKYRKIFYGTWCYLLYVQLPAHQETDYPLHLWDSL